MHIYSNYIIISRVIDITVGGSQRMKKWSLITISLILSVVMLSACGQKAAKNTDSDKANQPKNSTTSQASGSKLTIDSSKLIIGLSADFPPYEFQVKSSNGKNEIVGFDVEIAKEIAKDLGVELEIKDMPFSSVLNELKGERIDLILSGLSPTEERKKEIDFSNIYYTAEQAVVTLEENKDSYKTVDALKGKKIGVQMGSIQEGIAKEIEGATLTSLAKNSDIVMQLKSGRVDVAIMEGPVAKSFVKNVEGLVITDAKPQAEEEGYVVGIKKGHTEMVNQVNKTLDRLKAENKIEQFVLEATELAEKK